MSHHALQRALVVALHDPGFADAARADPTGVLGPFRLSQAEAAELFAVDPRAFTIDRLRRRRVLKAIVEELKGSVAIALAEVRRLAFAEGFFASSSFRAAVIEDRPLVLGLADYLAGALADGRLASPHLAGVLAIERAQAEARRDRDVGPPAPGLSLAPGIRLVASDSAALAALQACEQQLFELSLLPHIALCDDAPPLDLPPRADVRPLHLAVRASAGAAALDELPEPLFRSLRALAQAAARGRLDRDHVASVLAAVGLRVASTEKLVDDLIADGTLREGRPA